MSKIENFTVIIGAMKCGTTSLFRYLSQHPQVCGNASNKETMFFSRSTWESGLEGYLKLWDSYDHAIHKTALESSTEYTKFPTFPDVAERIYIFSQKYNVRFKFLYIVRNPMDMIASGLRHSYYQGWHSGDKQVALNQLVEVADFSRQISKYYDKFPADDILILPFADLIENPLATMNQISIFLDIDNFYEYKGLNAVFNSGSAREQRQKQNDLRDNMSRIKPVKYAARLLPRSWKRRLLPLVQRLSDKSMPGAKSRHEEAWVMDEEDRRFVIEKLQPGLIRLQEEFKIDITRWSNSFLEN